MADGTATQNPKVKPDYSALLEQAQLDYAKASRDGDEKAKKDAALRLALTYIQVGTLEEGSALATEIQRIAPNLMKTLAETRAALAKEGAQKSLELLKARFEDQRKLLEKESKDLFDLAKAGSEPTIRMMGTFKAIALLLKGAVGLDTDDFVKFCDEKIAEEQAKIPKINTARLADARVDVDTMSAELRVSKSVASALQEVADNAGKIADLVVEEGRVVGQRFTPTGGGQQAPVSGRPSASSADIETTRVIRAIQSGIGINTKLNLQEMVQNSDRSDGRGGKFSANDWSLLENKVSMGIFGNGEASDSASASAKAKQIIDRIRAKVAEDAPAPRPS